MVILFFTSVGPFRHLSNNIISYWMTFPSVKLHSCLSKFKAWSVSTVSGRNPSVNKFVKGVMLSAIQFHDFPCAAVLYKESKVAGESVYVREDKCREESFLILKQMGIPSDNMGLQWIYNQDIEFY